MLLQIDGQMRGNVPSSMESERTELLRSTSVCPTADREAGSAESDKDHRADSSLCCLNAIIVLALALGLAAGTLAARAPRRHFEAVLPEGQDVRKLIEEPVDMFRALGFVSAPFLVASLKGLLHFSAQLLFYLGATVLEGVSAARTRLTDPFRLNKAFVSFQVVGVMTTTAAYAQLIISLSPWASRGAFRTFALAISQHSATATLVLGLVTNSILARTAGEAADEEQRSLDISQAQELGRSAAKRLVIAGIAVGSPLWVTLLGTAWLQLPFIFPAAVFAVRTRTLIRLAGDLFSGLRATREGTLLHSVLAFNRDRGLIGFAIFFCLSANGLVAAWLVVGAGGREAWLLAGAAALELAAPLLMLNVLFYRMLALHAAECPQLLAFTLSMLCVFFIIQVIPAALLVQESDIGLCGSAGAAFTGKQIGPFFKYTFLFPSQDAWTVGDKAASGLTSVWLSQLVCFFT